MAKENTGAPGRSTIRNVQPLASRCTVTRFSNQARSWADTDPTPRDRERHYGRARLRRQPRWLNCISDSPLAGPARSLPYYDGRRRVRGPCRHALAPAGSVTPEWVRPAMHPRCPRASVTTRSVRVLGQGGMGTVYLAMDPGLQPACRAQGPPRRQRRPARALPPRGPYTSFSMKNSRLRSSRSGL